MIQPDNQMQCPAVCGLSINQEARQREIILITFNDKAVIQNSFYVVFMNITLEHPFGCMNSIINFVTG